MVLPRPLSRSQVQGVETRRSGRLGDLTKQQYGSLRQFCADHEVHFLPSYEDFLSAKKDCYPDEASVNITGTCASVSLQGILDKTAERLVQLLEPVVSALPSDCEVLLDCKAGFDGSSMHKAFKQKGNSSLRAENTIVFTGLDPLRLTSSNGQIIYQNERPNSSLACRPIEIQYAKESYEYVTGEWANLQDQVKTLVPTVCLVHNRTITVCHRVTFSMFDGKIKAQLTESSNQSCNVCRREPGDLNAIPPKMGGGIN
ncbi:hypothetical protein FOCC_FOCC013232 [Frankliniella occidentalis]|nr:hypothetical protein FOCC_FOCC013232 [Frankliniella occidentalis]